MGKKFTIKEHQAFAKWAKNKGLTFATIAEYNAAIGAYYDKD